MVLRFLVRRAAGANMIPGRARGTRAVFLAIMAVVVATGAVDAARAWCRSDPVVEIGGEIADVFVSAPAEAPTLVKGPTRVVITVPKGVSARLVVADPGFGKGTKVSFDKSKQLRTTKAGTEVHVWVYVPASENMPVRVEFAPHVVGVLDPATAEGTANKWIPLRTKL